MDLEQTASENTAGIVYAHERMPGLRIPDSANIVLVDEEDNYYKVDLEVTREHSIVLYHMLTVPQGHAQGASYIRVTGFPGGVAAFCRCYQFMYRADAEEELDVAFEEIIPTTACANYFKMRLFMEQLANQFRDKCRDFECAVRSLNAYVSLNTDFLEHPCWRRSLNHLTQMLARYNGSGAEGLTNEPPSVLVAALVSHIANRITRENYTAYQKLLNFSDYDSSFLSQWLISLSKHGRKEDLAATCVSFPKIIWQLFIAISDSQNEVRRVRNDVEWKAKNQADEIIRLKKQCESQAAEINILKKTFGEFQKRMTMK